MTKKFSLTKPRLFGGAAVFALLLAGCGSTVAIDLQTGDCLQLPEDYDLQGGFEMTSVNTTKCSEPHDAQVIGQEELQYAEFPGLDVIQEDAAAFCSAAFEEFVGTPLAESQLDVFPLSPTEDSWNKAEDRTLLCIAVNTTSQVSDTFKNSGR
ncbi:MAG: septum formation family protein [Actinomycetaceae bacterium]|nr:septum formation family protein [Actinomycetaceae bacterium]